jgi:hypothetical protein
MGAPSIPSLTGGSAGPATSGSDIQGLTAGTNGAGNRGFQNNFGQVNPPDMSTQLMSLPFLFAIGAVFAVLFILRRK